MNPCEMGLRCPYCIHCEDGDGCIYPYAVGVLPERGTFGLIDAAMECQAGDPAEISPERWGWLGEVIRTVTELRDREVRR